MHFEGSISHFIRHQFPDFYRDEGKLFVEFVKLYYEWMESSSDAPLYHARRLMNYKDIDETTNDFIVYFKEKYLKNVVLRTTTNTKQFVKHSLDIYRSKGTERSIDLFFSLVFGQPAEIYYPGTDVFRLSAAKWVIPTYLEVTPAGLNRAFVGQQIEGLKSGAKAFVERLVRKRINGRQVEFFQISSVAGVFRTGELVILSGSTTRKDCPYIVGSLSQITVTSGGDGFAVGDVVDVVSATGAGGKGRVSAIEDLAGAVDFDLVYGGWGYTPVANVIIADKILKLANVQSVYDNNAVVPTLIGRQVQQPKANVAYSSSSGSFVPGANVYTYYANNLVKGSGKVISVDEINATAGYVLVSIITGNLESNNIATLSNTVTANQDSYGDTTATGTIYGVSSNTELKYVNTAAVFSIGERVFQANEWDQTVAEGTVLTITAGGSGGTIKVKDTNGVWHTNLLIHGETTNATASLTSVSLDLGLANVSGTFVGDENFSNRLFDETSNTVANGTVLTVGLGSGADFTIAANLLYSETVLIANNELSQIANLQLNAPDWGLYMQAANLSSIINTALTYNSITLGMVSKLNGINPGENYNYTPFVSIYESIIARYGRQDFVLRISSATGTYQDGEMVVQTATGAKGIVRESNTTHLTLRRITFDRHWIANNTANTSWQAKGLATGVYSQVDEVGFDTISLPIGENANVVTNVVTSNSSVANIEVIDSGFSYVNNEEITFISADGERSGSGIGYVQQQGRGTGYYKTTQGFLSADKKLRDGDYYQDFSYEIRSPVTLDRYEKMLKSLLHVAGTKNFGAVVVKSDASVDVSASVSRETADQFGMSFTANSSLAGSLPANTIVGNLTFSVNNSLLDWYVTDDAGIIAVNGSNVYITSALSQFDANNNYVENTITFEATATWANGAGALSTEYSINIPVAGQDRFNESGGTRLLYPVVI